MYSSNSPSKRFQRDLSEPLLPIALDVVPQGSSVAEAVYNTLNVYVGLGLLSKPYAIAEGGWVSVAALALLCMIANVTGKLIVDGFAKLPPEDKSYAGLGGAAFGTAGRWFVRCVVTLEFCGALMVVLIFVWKNALLLAPWYLPDAIISIGTVALVTTAAATPTVWALDFGAMAGIGLLGVVASVLIVGVVVLVACVSAGEAVLGAAPVPPLALPLVGGGLPVATGIFVLSLGGHAALPGIYASMAEPHKFNAMLDVSLLCMFVIYGTVGVCGWLTYGWLKGEEVDILVTSNMASDATGGLIPLTLPGAVGQRQMSLEATLITLAVVAKSFTAISPVTGVLADLPEALLLGPPPAASAPAVSHSAFQRRQRGVRTALLWLLALCAYPCALFPNGLALVEAVTGALCSMLASLVLPCACWVALYHREVPKVHSAAAVLLALVAAAGGAAMTTVDIMKLGA